MNNKNKFFRKEVLDFMKVFIKKHEYNYIRKRLYDLDNAFRVCLDTNIIEVTKAYKHLQILNIFTNSSEEEKEVLDISKITTPVAYR